MVGNGKSDACGGAEARVGEAPRAKIVITVFGPRRPIAVEVIFETAADIEAVAVGGEETVNREARDGRRVLEIDSVVDIAIGKAANRVEEQVVEGVAEAHVGRSELGDRGRQIIQRERRGISGDASEIIFALHANDDGAHQLIIEANVNAAENPRGPIAVGKVKNVE